MEFNQFHLEPLPIKEPSNSKLETRNSKLSTSTSSAINGSIPPTCSIKFSVRKVMLKNVKRITQSRFWNITTNQSLMENFLRMELILLAELHRVLKQPSFAKKV